MVDTLISFLREYDINRVSELIRGLDWQQVARTPEVWVVGVPSLAILVWRRKFHLLLVMASVIAFALLLPLAMPAKGEAVPLNKILLFIGGSLVITVVNLYFFFIRRD
jgi:hypothetical protein